MALEPEGNYNVLVIRLHVNAEGAWQFVVEGADPPTVYPLRPIRLLIRVWHMRNTGLLRGQIQLAGIEDWVPFQSNARCIELIRTYLRSVTDEDGGNSGTMITGDHR